MTLRVVAHQIRRDRRSVQEEDESVDDEDANTVDIVGLVVVVADLLNHLFLLGIIHRMQVVVLRKQFIVRAWLKLPIQWLRRRHGVERPEEGPQARVAFF